MVIPAAEPILSPICLSCPGQHLAFQEIVTRTPVHLALDHLEAIDLPLDRAGAPGSVIAAFTASISRSIPAANDASSLSLASAIHLSRSSFHRRTNESGKAASEFRGCFKLWRMFVKMTKEATGTSSSVGCVPAEEPHAFPARWRTLAYMFRRGLGRWLLLRLAVHL